MSVDGINAIHTLRIDQDIQLPEQMVFYSLNQQAVINGKVARVDPAYAAYMGQTAKAQLEEKLASDELNLKNLLLDRIKSSLAETGRFVLLDQEPSLWDWFSSVGYPDAELKVHVTRYGMEIATELKRELFPVIDLDLNVQSSSDSPIWKGSCSLWASHPKNVGYPFKTYILKKDALHDVWQHAVSVCTKEAIKDLLSH